MTYTIIGGDGKEYGFISQEDIRKWVAENRLNAQSLVKAEGDAEFRPLSTFPEFADAFATHAPGTIAPVSAPAGDWATRDYELDIGDCVSRGWNLFKNDMGTLWCSFWLAMLVVIAVGFVFGLFSTLLIPKAVMQMTAFRLVYNVMVQGVLALVNGPIMGGIFYVFIQRMRGQTAGIGDVFIGFQRAFSQLFLGNFVVAFFVGLCLAPFNIYFAIKAQPALTQLSQFSPGMAGQTHPDLSQLWGAMAGTMPVLLICLIPTIYLTVCWQFTLPLIIDKQMDFWEAMTTSFKKVNKHWWYVFGFTVVIGLINLAGVLLCCVGVLFTATMTVAATMYVYETIFGESKAS